jgi:hypothetical protein
VNIFDSVQTNLIDSSNGEIIQLLQNIDINTLRPIDALNILADLKKKAEENV